MKKVLSCFTAAALLTMANVVFAVPQTVTLEVPGMSCALCPITIKKALRKVGGVSKVDVSFEKKQAVVTFDDSKTKVEALTKATANAGFPATVKQ